MNRSAGLAGRPWPKNYEALVRMFNKAGFFTEAQGKNFAYELCELVDCCKSMTKKVKRLEKEIKNANRNSMGLWLAACHLSGEFEHIRYHMRRAKTFINKLSDIAKDMPPLKGLTDDELSEYLTEVVLKDAYAALEKVKKKFTAAHRKEQNRLKRGKIARKKSRTKAAKLPKVAKKRKAKKRRSQLSS